MLTLLAKRFALDIRKECLSPSSILDNDTSCADVADKLEQVH